MIFPVLGLRSPPTTWCRNIAIALASRSGDTVRTAVANTAGDLLREVMLGDGALVAESHRPDGGLRDALIRSGRPFICTAVAPRMSVEHVCRENASAVLDVVRAVTTDVACLMPLVDAPGRLMLPSGAEGSGPGSVQAIASHFGVECSEDEARAIHEAALPQLAETETARALEFSRDEEVAVAGAVDGLNGILVDGRFERIAATRHFFTYAGSGKPPLDHVDATGRNQLLLFGPYISLPPGDWTARCVYGFSEGLVGTPMSIDVVHFLGGFHELARTSFTVTSSGRLDVNVRFLHTEPSALLEVRLFVDRAVFDGTVSFGFVEFRRNKADVNRSAASLMDFDPSTLS